MMIYTGGCVVALMGALQRWARRYAWQQPRRFLLGVMVYSAVGAVGGIALLAHNVAVLMH